VSKKEFLELLDKYLAGNASPVEEQFLFDVYQQIEDKYEWETPELETLDLLEHKLIERFKQSMQPSDVIAVPEKKEIPRFPFNIRGIFQIAASVLLLLSVTTGYWIYHNTNTSPKTSKIFVNQDSNDLITHANNTSGAEKIIFPDNSSVDLAAGSKVVYNKKFSGSLRQVYLTGEGFFQVTKNHAKPFIVYTDKLVAKVLGTSFIVKSGEHNMMASVLVKTGKVSVYKTNEFTAENAKPELTGGVIVLPNHLADLNGKAELEKKLPNSPEMLKRQPAKNFDFDNTPIDTVFSRLQDTYGITILYDKEKLNSCSLSVNMGKEDFYQKLDVICRTINASYLVRDGNVLVSGPGCAN